MNQKTKLKIKLSLKIIIRVGRLEIVVVILFLFEFCNASLGFPSDLDGKVSTCNAGDQGSIPESGRSPREENDNPLQYCFLENPTDGGAWEAAVHGVEISLATFKQNTWNKFFFLLLIWNI